MLFVGLAGSRCDLEDSRARVLKEIQCDFGLEAMKQQHLEKRVFLLEASHDHDVWRGRKLRDVFPSSEVMVGRSSESTWATNSWSLYQALRRAAEDSPTTCTTSVGSSEHVLHGGVGSLDQALRRATEDSSTTCTTSVSGPDIIGLSSTSDSVVQEPSHEQMARCLLEAQDFSMSSCLKLWPPSSKRRRSTNQSEVYVLLGQFTYGRFSSITKATHAMKQVTRVSESVHDVSWCHFTALLSCGLERKLLEVPQGHQQCGY